MLGAAERSWSIISALLKREVSCSPWLTTNWRLWLVPLAIIWTVSFWFCKAASMCDAHGGSWPSSFRSSSTAKRVWVSFSSRITCVSFNSSSNVAGVAVVVGATGVVNGVVLRGIETSSSIPCELTPAVAAAAALFNRRFIIWFRRVLPSHSLLLRYQRNT